MKFIKFTALLISGVIAVSVPGIAAVAAQTNEPSSPVMLEYGLADCNDVNIEYGIYGQPDGKPLMLLSPNGGDMHAFDGSILPEMSRHYRVITVSVRGTGKSDRGEGKLTFDVMSDDLYALLQYLNIEQTYIFGFSDGGNLGVVFTLAHPECVSKLAIMGANINTLGTNTNDQISIIFEFIWLSILAKITGNPETIRKRDICGMMVGQPSLTYDDISVIDIPVLNIYGEHDMIKRSHSEGITRAIPGAKGLMIVGGGHSTCFEQTDTVINPALLEFFGF